MNSRIPRTDLHPKDLSLSTITRCLTGPSVSSSPCPFGSPVAKEGGPRAALRLGGEFAGAGTDYQCGDRSLSGDQASPRLPPGR